MSEPRKPIIGLALGGGAARGWAHFGVIRALEEAGIKPDLVCGTSIGALVGAAYAAGDLEPLEEWVRGLSVRDVIGLMDVRLSSGILKGERLMNFFRTRFTEKPIEDLPMPFGAVATSLQTGAEVWLRKGSAMDAVRASIALPGLFSPVVHDGKVVVDGGLVNPVPVSLARAMGAELVIAVDLCSDIVGHFPTTPPAQPPVETPATEGSEWIRKLQDSLGALMPSQATSDEPQIPSMLDVMASSINIMQVRITRSRMAGDPPDLLVAPRLAYLGLLDFHRAEEAIEEGRRAVERVAHNLPLLSNQAVEVG